MMKKLFLVFILFFSPIVFISCDSSDSEEKVSYNYITFTVDGVDKTYSSYEDYGFISEIDNYWNVWQEDWDSDESDYVLFEIPTSVTSGETYTNTMDDADFSFSLTINGVDYSTDPTQPFTLTITEWGAIGGIVKGTFSGTLLQSSPGTDTVVITNGIFEATNNTDRTEK